MSAKGTAIATQACPRSRLKRLRRRISRYRLCAAALFYASMRGVLAAAHVSGREGALLRAVESAASTSSRRRRLRWPPPPEVGRSFGSLCPADRGAASFSWSPQPPSAPIGGRVERQLVPSASSERSGVYRTLSTTSAALGVRGGGGGAETMKTKAATTTAPPFKARRYHRAYLGVGANLGDRYGNVALALRLLGSGSGGDGGGDCDGDGVDVRVVRTSFLRETAPMYVTDQPAFLNGMVEVETTLSPPELLRRIKEAEAQLGRDLNDPERYGPRPVDIDIVMYGIGDDGGVGDGCDSPNVAGGSSWVVDSPDLVIPHPRMTERDFVLSPLCDISRSIVHPILNRTVQKMRDELLSGAQADTDEDADADTTPAVRVLPLPRGRVLRLNETVVMGILNVTPDSFSDGGKLGGSMGRAVEEALQMERDGAGIVDVGGESTRPGAKEVAIEEELRRTIPVIKGIREASDIPISIDTRHATVARAAIEAGADVVNDVSGASHDPDMLHTVAELGVPLVLMHMRGTPETMSSMTDYSDDGGVVTSVAMTLRERSEAAERAGVPRWMQVLDPGIGFAKGRDESLSLLRNTRRLRELVGGDFPLLLGPSRKGFIGAITGEARPEELDYGSAAACVAAVAAAAVDGGKSEGGTILRVHNVRGARQAALVMDAVLAA